MKIRDLLAAESIELNGKVTGKKEALDAMVDLMAKSGKRRREHHRNRRRNCDSALQIGFGIKTGTCSYGCTGRG